MSSRGRGETISTTGSRDQTAKYGQLWRDSPALAHTQNKTMQNTMQNVNASILRTRIPFCVEGEITWLKMKMLNFPFQINKAIKSCSKKKGYCDVSCNWELVVPQGVWHLCVVPAVDVKDPYAGGGLSLTVGFHLPAEDRDTCVWRRHWRWKTQKQNTNETDERKKDTWPHIYREK